MKKYVYYNHRQAKFIIETYEGNVWNKKNVVQLDEDIIGQKLYCTSYGLQSVKNSFIKNQIYIVEKVSSGKTTAGRVKFKGVKGYHDLKSFEPIENNAALYRESQINEIMDIGIFSDKKIRRIDSMPQKNRVLIQLFVQSFTRQIGVEGDRANLNSNISYDEIIDEVLRYNAKFELTKQDYEEIANLTIKQLVDSYVKEINLNDE